MVKLQATIDARVAEGASTAGQQALAAADAAALLRGMGVDVPSFGGETASLGRLSG